MVAINRSRSRLPGCAVQYASVSITSHAVTATATGISSSCTLSLRGRFEARFANGASPVGAVFSARDWKDAGARSRSGDVQHAAGLAPTPPGASSPCVHENGGQALLWLWHSELASSPSVVNAPAASMLDRDDTMERSVLTRPGLGMGQARFRGDVVGSACGAATRPCLPLPATPAAGRYRHFRASMRWYTPANGCGASARTVMSTASAD